MDDQQSDSGAGEDPDPGFTPANAPGGFRDVTSDDVTVDAEGKKIVSPDYQVAKSNRMSFSIVGVFTAIVVLLFLGLIIAYAVN